MTPTSLILIFSFFFIIGAIPFSLIIGKLAGIDIRNFGDGNPGTENAFIGGGILVGIPAGILDFLKGAIPLYLILNKIDLYNFNLIPISLAPVLGHTFSPFLKLKGGKGIAVTYGIWSVLTNLKGPVIMLSVYGTINYILKLKIRAIRIPLSILSVSGYLLLFQYNIVLIFISILNSFIIFTKFSKELFPISINKHYKI